MNIDVRKGVMVLGLGDEVKIETVDYNIYNHDKLTRKLKISLDCAGKNLCIWNETKGSLKELVAVIRLNGSLRPSPACFRCDGDGRLFYDDKGNRRDEYPCPKCEGTGSAIKAKPIIRRNSKGHYRPIPCQFQAANVDGWRDYCNKCGEHKDRHQAPRQKKIV